MRQKLRRPKTLWLHGRSGPREPRRSSSRPGSGGRPPVFYATPVNRLLSHKYTIERAINILSPFERIQLVIIEEYDRFGTIPPANTFLRHDREIIRERYGIIVCIIAIRRVPSNRVRRTRTRAV